MKYGVLLGILMTRTSLITLSDNLQEQNYVLTNLIPYQETARG